MNSKERVEILLNKEISDRMGLFEHFWGETLTEWARKEDYPEFKNPCYFFDFDIAPCGGWINTQPFIGRREVIKETEEWEIVKDGRGATLKLWKNKSGTPEHIGFEVTERKIWETYKEPLFEVDERRFGDIEKIKENIKKAREKNKFVVFGDLFVFELLRATIGDTNFLPALLLEPEWIHDFCQTYTDFFIKHYEKLFQRTGLPDGFFIYEDFGYHKGLFCSPKTLSEMIMPYEKKFVSFLKDYNLPVLLHSCGNILEAIPLIINAGFDCLQPMEAKAGCDVVEIAKTYGNRIAYMGNINVVVLNTNDEEKIRGEIEYKVNSLKEMKIPYFFHSDHSIPPSVKFKTYSCALEIFKRISYY